ncbi:HAD-IA family hydrolase [Candidatus Peregrinibacteria bacterium]|nr:HAD-IA family hydrolase [Candidatus Peregrinibacteria bacterium]
MKIPHDHHREGFTFHKLFQLFKLLHPKNTKALLRINEFTDLDLKKIQKLTGNPVKGIILDVDDTIAYNRGKILKKNVEHLNTLLRQGVKIALYSNMIWTKRYENLDKRIIILADIEAKPNPNGFKKAIRKLQTKRKNTIMVGDNFVTDAGTIPMGIPFIKVKPIKTIDKNPIIRILRVPHRAIRWIYDQIALLHDKFLRN